MYNTKLIPKSETRLNYVIFSSFIRTWKMTPLRSDKKRNQIEENEKNKVWRIKEVRTD